MLEIKTRELETRKKVLIDGHEYIVRRFGAGEELLISQIVRRTNQLAAIIKKDGKLNDEQERELDNLADTSIKMYASTYDDGGDGSKALKLIESLTISERQLMHNQIFLIPELDKIVNNEVDHAAAQEELAKSAEADATDEATDSLS